MTRPFFSKKKEEKKESVNICGSASRPQSKHPPLNRFIRVILADFTSGRTEPEFHSWVPSINSGPHSRTTVPLPRHLLQQLLQSAADFFRELLHRTTVFFSFALLTNLRPSNRPSPTLTLFVLLLVREFYLQCTTMGPA